MKEILLLSSTILFLLNPSNNIEPSYCTFEVKSQTFQQFIEKEKLKTQILQTKTNMHNAIKQRQKMTKLKRKEQQRKKENNNERRYLCWK